MSTTTHTSGREKELRDRDALLDSLITNDNHEILFTKDSMLKTANFVSEIMGRKMTQSEVSELFAFVKLIPPERYFNRKLGPSLKSIADQFLQRKRSATSLFSPDGRIEKSIGLDQVSDGPADMHEYNKMELGQLTANENQLKYTLYPNKRGNAVIDRARADGDHSSPDGLAPFGSAPAGSPASAGGKVSTELLSSIKMLNSFLDPKNIKDTFSGMRQAWTTYQTITLPHQTIPLDTRNRLLNITARDRYGWYINNAGFAGQQGNIQLQDTLQEVIKMQISPFWIPCNNALNNYYGKIRMLIKEFSSQSITINEFPFADSTAPMTYQYHFEFEAKRRNKNKLYLVPVHDTFIFRTSYAQVNALTVVFRAPFNTVDFDNDRLTMTVSSAAVAVVSSSIPHNLATGDIVYFTNYNSVSTTLNNTVNSLNGYFITKLSPTTFSVPIDTTAAGVPNISDVYFGSKRIVMQIEFTSLES